jgi:tRNA pseudouridine55 synthase
MSESGFFAQLLVPESLSGTEEPVGPLRGFLILDKPPGITSMQAVAVIRKRAGGRPLKVGHAGTLDPLASGVLVIAIGRAATREIDCIQALPKRYATTIDLSAFTETDDLEGARRDVPVANPPDRDAIEKLFVSRFTGSILQTPPAFSAVKLGGQRAYRLARGGPHGHVGRDDELAGGLKTIESRIAPRVVRIDSIRIVDYSWPMLAIEVHCSKGTYIRRLARDIGVALGTGGHCVSLRRTAIGPFTESSARTLISLPARLDQEDLLSSGVVCAIAGSPGGAGGDSRSDVAAGR